MLLFSFCLKPFCLLIHCPNSLTNTISHFSYSISHTIGICKLDFGSTDESTDEVADNTAAEADDHDTRVLVHSKGTLNIYREADGCFTYEDASGNGTNFTAHPKKDGSFCPTCIKNCLKPEEEWANKEKAGPCHHHRFKNDK